MTRGSLVVVRIRDRSTQSVLTETQARCCRQCRNRRGSLAHRRPLVLMLPRRDGGLIQRQDGFHLPRSRIVNRGAPGFLVRSDGEVRLTRSCRLDRRCVVCCPDFPLCLTSLISGVKQMTSRFEAQSACRLLGQFAQMTDKAGHPDCKAWHKVSVGWS